MAWTLRDRFDQIDELESLPQLERALEVVGPFEESFESQSGEWRLVALVRGERRHLLVVACRADQAASLVRRNVRR